MCKGTEVGTVEEEKGGQYEHAFVLVKGLHIFSLNKKLTISSKKNAKQPISIQFTLKILE